MAWLKSKSVWGAVIVAVASIVRVAKPEWSGAVDAVIGVGAAIGIVGVRHAIAKGSHGSGS